MGPKGRGNFEEAEEDDLSRRATIRDVAEAAGVSKATVSRVLAGNYPVSRETADRVRAAVDLLSYSAKASARSLATGRADAFAVVVSEPLATFFADPDLRADPPRHHRHPRLDRDRTDTAADRNPGGTGEGAPPHHEQNG